MNCTTILPSSLQCHFTRIPKITMAAMLMLCIRLDSRVYRELDWNVKKQINRVFRLLFEQAREHQQQSSLGSLIIFPPLLLRRKNKNEERLCGLVLMFYMYFPLRTCSVRLGSYKQIVYESLTTQWWHSVLHCVKVFDLLRRWWNALCQKDFHGGWTWMAPLI